MRRFLRTIVIGVLVVTMSFNPASAWNWFRGGRGGYGGYYSGYGGYGDYYGGYGGGRWGSRIVPVTGRTMVAARAVAAPMDIRPAVMAGAAATTRVAAAAAAMTRVAVAVAVTTRTAADMAVAIHVAVTASTPTAMK